MTMSFATVPKARADRRAYHNCRVMNYWRATSPRGTNARCKVAYGFPSCALSYTTACSPNDKYWNTCRVWCAPGCYQCEPLMNSARAAACNGGTCSCTPITI
jgi:hypothetical protein